MVYPQPEAQDNAEGQPGVSMQNNNVAVTYYQTGFNHDFEIANYDIKYTATDASDRQAMCEFTIDVKSKNNVIMKYYTDTTYSVVHRGFDPEINRTRLNF